MTFCPGFRLNCSRIWRGITIWYLLEWWSRHSFYVSWINTFANFEIAFYDRHIWWFLKTLYPHIGDFWMLINFGESITGSNDIMTLLQEGCSTTEIAEYAEKNNSVLSVYSSD